MKKMMFAALAAPMILAYSTSSFSAETKVALCYYCNSQAFRNAAEVTALQESPRLQQGVQFVFVADTGTDEIRYYEIVRDYVETCLERDKADAKRSRGPVFDPGNPPEFPNCFSSWVTTSTQLAPPAATVAEMRDMQAEFEKFRQEIQDVDVSELPIGIIPLDSATDLIGLPSASHDPEVFRNSLVNAMSARAAESWWASRLNEARQVAEAFVDKLVDLTLPQRVTVTFPNGTRIDVKLISPFKDENGNFAGLILEVIESSARGEQVSSIPTTTAGFISVFQNGYTGNVSAVENYADLFVRAGGRVRTGPPRENCSATIMCWIENGVEVCQESFPDPQLGC